MNDIEARIRGWRRTLLAGEGLHDEQVDELEDHLREEMQHLRSAALSEDEAFLVATHRLGRADAIASEFDRADPRAVWRGRWIWMLCGFLGFNVFYRLDQLSAAYLVRPGQGFANAFYYAMPLIGLMAILAFTVWTVRESRSGGERRGRFRSSRKQPVLLGLALVISAIMASLPWLNFITSVGGSHGVKPETAPALSYAGFQILFWLGPIVALAILMRRERKRGRLADEMGAA